MRKERKIVIEFTKNKNIHNRKIAEFFAKKFNEKRIKKS